MFGRFSVTQDSKECFKGAKRDYRREAFSFSKGPD
jgi:hypothetical protein